MNLAILSSRHVIKQALSFYYVVFCLIKIFRIFFRGTFISIVWFIVFVAIDTTITIVLHLQFGFFHISFKLFHLLIRYFLQCWRVLRFNSALLLNKYVSGIKILSKKTTIVFAWTIYFCRWKIYVTSVILFRIISNSISLIILVRK